VTNVLGTLSVCEAAVAAGHGPDERQHVLRQPEDAGPAMRHRNLPAHELVEEGLERGLDRRRRLLHVRELIEDRDVAEAAEQDPPVRELLPVVEALPCVVRAVVEAAVERFARDHLTARRPDQVGELRDEAVPVAVRRDKDAIRVERLEVLDQVVLAQLGACLRGPRGEAANEACRLDRAVAGVGNRTAEAAGRSTRDVLEPFRLEAVLAQRLVLEPDAFPLLLVRREAVAAGASKRVTAELGHPLERLLGPAPERSRPLRAVRLPGDVVAGGPAAKDETAVPAARTFRDSACVVHAHAEAGLGETKRGRAAGDASADDRDVDPPVLSRLGVLRCRILEPVRVHEARRYTPSCATA